MIVDKVKGDELYPEYKFMELENFVSLLYRQLNLSKIVDDKTNIRIVRMIKLTKDFNYESEGNFDKVSYLKKIDDRRLIKIKDNEIVSKNGVKININAYSKYSGKQKRVASVYLYY